jgi:hypothetical protein
MSEKGNYHGIMCNETPIEVGESKKILNIININWGDPIKMVWTL